jgi:hypothetical protein
MNLEVQTWLRTRYSQSNVGCIVSTFVSTSQLVAASLSWCDLGMNPINTSPGHVLSREVSVTYKRLECWTKSMSCITGYISPFTYQSLCWEQTRSFSDSQEAGQVGVNCMLQHYNPRLYQFSSMCDHNHSCSFIDPGSTCRCFRLPGVLPDSLAHYLPTLVSGLVPEVLELHFCTLSPVPC